MDKILLQNVSFIYNPNTAFESVALDKVSLAIGEDKITGIIGHTGSGKSTLVQLFNGLSKPSDGKIFLDGVELHKKKKDLLEQLKEAPYNTMKKGVAKKTLLAEYKNFERNLCFKVGLVMQYPEYQLFEETVRKDIAFGPTNMHLSPEEIEQRVLEASELAGIDKSLLDKHPFDLSGGQKRRVALAGVMAMKPEVLVLDEPAAGLDPRGRDSIFAQIVNYQRTTHATVLIVSHSMEDMARYADNLVVLSKGKLLYNGTKEEVLGHIDELSETGLDAPQITHMVRYLRENGLPIRENIYTVKDAVLEIEKLFKEAKK